MKVTFVGLNPSLRGSGCRSLRVLDEWATENLGLSSWGFMNVIPDAESPKKTSEVEWDFVSELQNYPESKIVALGEFPSMVLRRLGIKHHRIPHPSGRNRTLNDPRFVEQVLSECRRYLYEED